MDTTLNITGFLEKKKQIIWISRALIAFIFVLVFFLIPSAFALHGVADNSKEIEDVKEIVTSNRVYYLIADTMGIGGGADRSLSPYGDLYDDVTGGATAAPSGRVTATDISSVSIIQDVFRTMMWIGGAFCIIVAFTHLLQQIEKGQDLMEAVIRNVAELGIAMILVVNSPKILMLAKYAGTIMITILSRYINGHVTVGGYSTITDEQAEEILQTLTGDKTGYFMWQIEVAVKLSVVKAMNSVLTIAAKFVVLQLILELAIRQALTPIYIANMYKEGLRSPGMRHLKQYFAVYLKMVVCIMIAGLGTQLIPAIDTHNASVIVEIIAINLTLIMAMFKSSEYINTFTQ